MTERERVLSILDGQIPDRLPWFGDLDYYVTGLKTDNVLPDRYIDRDHNDGFLNMHRDYGVGFYLQGYFPFKSEISNADIKIEKNDDITTRTISTPLGSLHETLKYSRASYSTGITEYLIKNLDDLKKYAYVCEHTHYSPDYELAQWRSDNVGDSGVTLCYTPRSPLMELVAVLAGIENITYMIVENEDEFSAIIRSLEDSCSEACRLAIESPAECIMIPENISSECVTSLYSRFMKGYHSKWTEYIRKAGKYSFVHLDGTVRGLVSQLSKESKFDVIEAITPMPVGDVSIDEVAELVDDSTIIWGGIPGGMFRTEYTSDEDFDRHVLRCIEVMTQNPRYVLGVADQVVPGSSEERIKRVRELVDEYGKYNSI